MTRSHTNPLPPPCTAPPTLASSATRTHFWSLVSTTGVSSRPVLGSEAASSGSGSASGGGSKLRRRMLRILRRPRPIFLPPVAGELELDAPLLMACSSPGVFNRCASGQVCPLGGWRDNGKGVSPHTQKMTQQHVSRHASCVRTTTAHTERHRNTKITITRPQAWFSGSVRVKGGLGAGP